MSTHTDHFPTETDGLAEAREPEVIELGDGEEFELKIAPVVKQIGDSGVRMLAYNGSIPGPTLRVKEGSEVLVNVINEGDHENTVHWHGLRLDNRYDGTHETQDVIPIGGSFQARVAFPDPGAYWYHPHIREDYGQELGLYGNVIVEPSDADYFPPVHRDVAMTLDDILLEDGKIASFSPDETTHSAMGRFGNTMLTRGETDLELEAKAGEVVRFYFTNTANTRVFKVKVPGAQMKLVGGDSGHVEREELVDSVILAPSERVIVDVLFAEPGDLALEHHTPGHVYPLARIQVGEDRAEPLDAEFEELRTNADLAAERERTAADLEREPDKRLAFIAEMDLGGPEGDGPVVYACPMHPEVMSEEEGTCPECAMKLIAVEATYTCPMHPEVVSQEQGKCPECGMKLLPSQLIGEAHEHGGHEHSTADGIEWEDDMVDINKLTTPANFRWKLIDRDADAENHEIDLAIQSRRSGEDSPSQRDGRGPSDAPPLPHTRGRALPRPGPRRRGRAEPGLVRHGLDPGRPDRRHPARRHEPGSLDGSLPYRRASRERNDVQLRRQQMRIPAKGIVNRV